jgi:hypothetical protein
MTTAISADQLLQALLPTWYQLLQQWSLDGRLSAAAQEALLLSGEPEQLTALTEQWAEGDFSGLPPIVLLPASSMPTAAGAYADSTGTIYLNQDWLETASTDAVLSVLTQELGHHLDALLNSSDTPGDEGALFATLLENPDLSAEEIEAYRSADDKGEISIEGNDISSEFSTAPTREILGDGSRVRLATNSLTPLNQSGGTYIIPEKGGTISFTMSRSYSWKPSFGEPAPRALSGFLEVYYIHESGIRQSIPNSTPFLDAGTPGFSYFFQSLVEASGALME